MLKFFKKKKESNNNENSELLLKTASLLVHAAKIDQKFTDKERNIINQWLMAQMALVGPLIGQHHQFHHYNPGKSEFGEQRYFKITKRIYGELDARLKESKFLAGPDYTIADIATWPWMARHEWHDIGLKNYKNLSRWYLEIAEREAVIKGFNFMDKDLVIPKP